VGCGEQPSALPVESSGQSDVSKLAPPKPPVLRGSQPEYPRDDGGGTTERAADSQLPPRQATETVKAEAGVGLRGRRLEDEHLVQMIVTPARELFRIEQRLVFDVQIPHALDLYQALNGSRPKSHEEFMKQIIAANQIALPALPEGERYVYDPAKGELMVQRPAR
jgi:hypothetical protein